jgi:E3 ubiquitin-protein ligase NEDD4
MVSTSEMCSVRFQRTQREGTGADYFLGFPDPFAVVTVNGEQTKTTAVSKRTLNPYWNESFDFCVNEASIIAIQVFDQKKFKKKDQGFLGVINIRVGDVMPELTPEADGKFGTAST